MLPTPHGPAGPPAPRPTPAEQATPVPDEVTDHVLSGRTPDAVALLRVVEHLADAPAIDPTTGGTSPADDSAADDSTAVDTDADSTADDTSADSTADDTVADSTADDTAPPVAAPAPAALGPTALEPPASAPLAPAPLATDVVGPVAAALSDTRHTVDELNAPERVFLAQQRALIGELCPDPADADAVGALFDRVREQWTQAEDRPDPRPLAEAFGVALGDLVRAGAPDLAWATCSDRYGVEIVLARQDPEVLVYPIASVGQSWSTAAPGWFVAHLAHILRGVTTEPTPADA
ncbi:DUF3806 domain-containing protein [Cellulomonas wangsupingiae]|uniref:DUF3806 domain-containing protein n=1 Tax=Cellulomonas wangsupingiae TaxID=2968085 RepID=A0ABY5K5K7_9CELL|nr:DUF3806 domain-containing protein [Cellulomonas wangsupingiae]MCC2336287.1 DUF3806 domain-containing protein [Cellulomonas wangsupingiae]UUI65732.1 DUF3806 domain-containing protein [Cellulomonas wangsupingiae]